VRIGARSGALTMEKNRIAAGTEIDDLRKR
jgi:hypothetical protein